MSEYIVIRRNSTKRPTAKVSKKKKSSYIGLHLHKEDDSYISTLKTLKKNVPELNHVQIFTHGPGNIHKIQIDAGFKNILKQLDITCNVHGSYLCVPWKSPFLMHHTIENFRASHKLGATDTILHIPFAPIDEWIDSIIKLAAKLKKEKLRPKIMLETSATIADKERSYETPAKLNKLWVALKKVDIHNSCGICIDTAHIYSSGVDIREFNTATEYLKLCSPGMIQSIQLNGNSIPPGILKTRDIHEIPGSAEDLIWKDISYENSGCRAFVEYAIKNNISCTIEWSTKRHSMSELRRFLNDINALK